MNASPANTDSRVGGPDVVTDLPRVRISVIISAAVRYMTPAIPYGIAGCHA
jgi:hypothetical protein